MAAHDTLGSQSGQVTTRPNKPLFPGIPSKASDKALFSPDLFLGCNLKVNDLLTVDIQLQAKTP